MRDPALPADVFKIGRTNDLRRRLGEYPRGCRYLYTFGCLVDCHECERRLIELFKSRFERFPGRALEYFRGRPEDVAAAFASFCVGDPSPMVT